MAWVALDDRIYDHPKMIGLELEAVGLWCLCLAWSGGQLTDGHLPEPAVRRLAATARHPDRIIARLVTAGLWDEVDGGWQIHDFLDFQPSSHEVKARRRRVSEARSKAGKKGADARWQTDSKPDGNGDGKPMANASQTGSKPDGKRMAPSPTPTPPTNGYISVAVNSLSVANDQNGSEGVCERCDCTTDRPGTYTDPNGRDVICDHALNPDEYLA